MRIGIITFWESNDNYGMLFQTYALQQFLRENGYDPFLIRYSENSGTKEKFHLASKLKNIFHLISWFHYLKNRYLSSKYNKTTDNTLRRFACFRENYLEMTEETYDHNKLMTNPPLADVYICGSDQIWGGATAFYLDFVPANKLKIAYAPSFGGVTVQRNELEVASLLASFSYVSVREYSGVELCAHLGRPDAIRVVDPTLLLSEMSYDTIKQYDNSLNEKYIFLYMLGNETYIRTNEIFKYASSHRLSVKYVASQGRYDKFPKEMATPEEWLGLIENAELVVTNSYHATIFSILYKKQFVTLALKGPFSRMNVRVEELLADCGMLHRLCYRDFDKVMENPFSESGAIESLLPLINRSKIFLLNALKEGAKW